MLRSTVWFLTLIIVVVAAASCARNEVDDSDSDSKPSAANTPDERAASKENDWAADYRDMVSRLKLSDEEAKKLKEAFDEREKRLSAWMEEKGRQLNEFEKKMLEAARSRDLGNLETWKKKAEPLRKELVETTEKLKRDIRAALPESKRVEWDAHRLSERLLDLMKPLKLSEEQTAEIREKAKSVAQDSAAEPNPQAAGFLALEGQVEKEVLTAEQRAEYQKVKKRQPFRSMKQ